MSHDMEDDPEHLEGENDEEYQHDQLPTVDEILVDQRQGKIISGSNPADDDVQSDPRRGSTSSEKKMDKCLWNAVKILFVTMMVVSGFAVGFLTGESRGEEEQGTTSAGKPYKETTEVETGDASIPIERLDVTRDDLVYHGLAILGGSEFDNSNSYQFRALDVLIENGISVDDDPNTENGRQKLAQRYALLCLYYSTNGVRTSVTDAQFGYGTTPKWHNKNVPAPWKFQWGDDECDWSGVVCDGRKLVTRIELVNHLLTGFLPMELQLLNGGPIEVLDFSNNRGLGEGGFPKVFSEFDSLGEFYLRFVG